MRIVLGWKSGNRRDWLWESGNVALDTFIVVAVKGEVSDNTNLSLVQEIQNRWWTWEWVWGLGSGWSFSAASLVYWRFAVFLCLKSVLCHVHTVKHWLVGTVCWVNFSHFLAVLPDAAMPDRFHTNRQSPVSFALTEQGLRTLPMMSSTRLICWFNWLAGSWK